ncbi:hypothetical protein [Mesorhizobium sp. M8A.F.Ca.ET.165.01.1.1]|uniref:hypothetical protein n=1 Tax=Mesorhizobium sp. M8A.F.Ca.ET.165.01.1.1 TaxID=2563960 RepID=UPI001093B73A|nr:hypothetical protein [Mesorhizobium sp. M8A.F.Ca.ET.165.01.1.1]TGT42775.1 hypothetical protein EN808_12905 [Mesorhizobium sp. M8A.F.Ca.ET.165.01.1.1]
MTDENVQATQAAEEQNQESSDVAFTAPMEELKGLTEAETQTTTDAGEEQPAEQQPQATKPEPDEKDKRIAKLEADLKRNNDRMNGFKADKKVVATAIKALMDEYGIDYEEAAKKVNLAAADLKARVESPDVAENPVEVQNLAFDDLYIKQGFKDTLDELMGEDTQKYVKAFGAHAFNDPELLQEYLATPKAKLPAFVVKIGKELFDELGEGSTSTRAQAKRIKELEDEIKALKGESQTTQEQSETVTRKALPLSGSTGAAKPQPKDKLDAMFGY